MSCPNTSATGCKCPEHALGLMAYACEHEAATTPPVRLSVVTAGPPPSRLPIQDASERLINQARAECASCHGNADSCHEGSGPPHFNRLPGCAAWTEDGQPAALKAEPAPIQPWEPKPARTRQAA